MCQKMYNKNILTFVLTALCALVTSSLIEDVDPMLAQQKFAFQLVRHAYGRRSDPALDANDDECFNYYFNEQEKISKEYNTDYDNCKDIAEEAKNKLVSLSNVKRDEVIARGNGTCADLYSCQKYEDGIEFFQCYSVASGSNYQVLYSLHTETSMEATNLQVFYQAIDNEEKNCTTLAKNKYVASMATCNTDLDKCLNGAPLPTQTTSTSTSNEPTTDTTPTTTKAPTTTKEPQTTKETTTEQPPTTEPMPEEDLDITKTK